ATTVVGKVESNDVFARRELISRRYAVLVLLLNRILVAILIGKRIGEHGFAVEHKQAPTAKASSLSDDDPVGPTLGDINICADAERREKARNAGERYGPKDRVTYWRGLFLAVLPVYGNWTLAQLGGLPQIMGGHPCREDDGKKY